MEKSKLGISLPLLAGLTFLICYFGGYVIGGILIGYILLKEESTWLKKQAILAAFLMIAFSVLNLATNFIPNLLDIPESALEIFGVYINLNIIDSIFNFLYNIVYILKIVAFGLFTFFGFMKKDLKIAALDNFIAKHFE